MIHDLLIGQYGLWYGAGVLLHSQVDWRLARMQAMGTLAMMLAGGLLALYIGFKWWERRRFFRMLRMARISVNRGFARVRPLHGGLDAWVAAGHEVAPLG
jgi:hypothetical protein